jgi:hypothetical protein
MKRALGILALFVAPTLILAAALQLDAARGMPQEARAELGQYLAYRYAGPPPLVVQPRAATRPWRLTASTSGATYGDSHFFRTAHDDAPIAAQARARSTVVGDAPFLGGSEGAQPIPYPPQELWCADVQPPGELPLTILVALHADLYNADWIVHEMPGAWSPEERQAGLAELGCASE